jgi:hypothetical protein
MERRGSEGDASKRKNRFSCSLSATRNLFRNRENLDRPENEEEILSHPLSPEIERSVHSSRHSSSQSDSDSDSDTPTEKSSIYSRKDREDRKSRWYDRSERNYREDYARKSKSESRKQREKAEKDRQKKLEAKHMEYTRSNSLGSPLLDIVADNMALHKNLNFKESNLQ